MGNQNTQRHIVRKDVRRRAKRQLLRGLSCLGVLLVLAAVLVVIALSAGPTLGRRSVAIPTPDFSHLLIHMSVYPYMMP